MKLIESDLRLQMRKAIPLSFKSIDAALRAGHTAEAELLRQRLLRLNPHHLLKPYASFAEAAGHPDIQSYIEELRLKYPVEVAEGQRVVQGPYVAETVPVTIEQQYVVVEV